MIDSHINILISTRTNTGTLTPNHTNFRLTRKTIIFHRRIQTFLVYTKQWNCAARQTSTSANSAYKRKKGTPQTTALWEYRP